MSDLEEPTSRESLRAYLLETVTTKALELLTDAMSKKGIDLFTLVMLCDENEARVTKNIDNPASMTLEDLNKMCFELGYKVVLTTSPIVKEDVEQSQGWSKS